MPQRPKKKQEQKRKTDNLKIPSIYGYNDVTIEQRPKKRQNRDDKALEQQPPPPGGNGVGVVGNAHPPPQDRKPQNVPPQPPKRNRASVVGKAPPPPQDREIRNDPPGESETDVVAAAHPNKTSATGSAPSHWGKVKDEFKKMTTPKLVDFVEKAMETLSEERGIEYLQELLRKDFEDLKEKLHNDKPLVVIITTHGSAIDRDKYNIFSRFHESVKKIKKSTYEFLKDLLGKGKTDAEKEENVEVTFVKANTTGYCQEFSPLDAGDFQTIISDWFKEPGNKFDEVSVQSVSDRLKDRQFPADQKKKSFFESLQDGTIHMYKMARQARWLVGKQNFDDEIKVDGRFNKIFSLSINEILQYNWSDMLIHVLDKDGNLIPFPRLFSDHAHLFGGAEKVENRKNRRYISYSQLIKLLSNFSKKMVCFDFTCDLHGKNILPTYGPYLIGGAPKTKKRKSKMSQKSRKNKEGSNKKGKSRKYTKGKTRNYQKSKTRKYTPPK